MRQQNYLYFLKELFKGYTVIYFLLFYLCPYQRNKGTLLSPLRIKINKSKIAHLLPLDFFYKNIYINLLLLKRIYYNNNIYNHFLIAPYFSRFGSMEKTIPKKSKSTPIDNDVVMGQPTSSPGASTDPQQ